MFTGIGQFITLASPHFAERECNQNIVKTLVSIKAKNITFSCTSKQVSVGGLKFGT